MPFPANLESLQAAGYVYSHWQVCPECGEGTEVWSTPGKRELAMQPMCELLRPAIRHYERCNIAPKQEEQSVHLRNEASGRTSEPTGPDSDGGTDGNLGRPGGTDSSGHSEHGVPDGRLHAQGSGIKLYGIRDKNMMAVGWQDGTLKVAFRFGTYLYANVAEDAYLKIKANPYPNALFVKLVKNHPELCPCTKVA